MEVTLQQILEARDSRAKLQQRLQQQFHCPVVCFTMNIPGPVKNTPLIRRAFGYGLQILEGQLPGILHKEILDASTGCEAMYAVDEDALQLKRICTAIEDSTPLGRLFDMDVLDVRGNKLDRNLVNGNSRDCIVCGAPGRGCASRRLHTLDELQVAVAKIMETHFLQMDRDTIAALAVQSLLDEVNTTPKPGLVDRRNNGSHKDMDITTFSVSAETLRPYFQTCVQIGQATAQCPPEETFAQLRRTSINVCSTSNTTQAKIRHLQTRSNLLIACGVVQTAPQRPWAITCQSVVEADAIEIYILILRIISSNIKTHLRETVRRYVVEEILRRRQRCWQRLHITCSLGVGVELAKCRIINRNQRRWHHDNELHIVYQLLYSHHNLQILELRSLEAEEILSR